MTAYRAVVTAGRWTVVVGWLELILLPFVIYLAWLVNPKLTRAELVGLAAVNALFMVTLSAVLVINGRELSHPSLQATGLEIKIRLVRVIWVIIGSGILGLLLGGQGIGLIFFVLLYQLLRALVLLRRLEADPPPPGPGKSQSKDH
jgi:hypothetical protein